MNRLSNIMKICTYEFRIQMFSKRVWLGYLLGIVIILHGSFSFSHYVQSYGETANILETFIVVGNSSSTSMFVVLGWLLIISEAPFVNNNVHFLISRTNRQNWNVAVLLYIFLQCAIYYSMIAVSTIIFSICEGFGTNGWSAPLINLTENPYQSDITVSFPYATFIKEVSVFKAFGYTWVLGFLYGLSLGLILYVFSLFLNQVAGAAVTFFFHFLGYETMAEGLGIVIKYSLFARSMPVLQIGVDLGASIVDTFMIYFLFLWILFYATNRIIKYIDLKEISDDMYHW